MRGSAGFQPALESSFLLSGGPFLERGGGRIACRNRVPQRSSYRPPGVNVYFDPPPFAKSEEWAPARLRPRATRPADVIPAPRPELFDGYGLRGDIGQHAFECDDGQPLGFFINLDLIDDPTFD